MDAANPPDRAEVAAPDDLPAPFDAGVDAQADGRADGAPDAADGAAPCPAPATRCGDRCVDTSADGAHCGACGRACADGQRCMAGACGAIPGALARRVGTAGDETAGELVRTADGVYVIGTYVGATDLGGGPVAGSSVERGYLVALERSGAFRWARVLESTDLLRTRSLAADASGNVYVAGEYRGMAAFGALEATVGAAPAGFVVSYSPAGASRWARGLGPGSAGAVAVDAAGRVLVGGSLDAPVDLGGGRIGSGTDDAFLAALDAATGAHVWSRAFGDRGPATVNDIVAAPDGSLYVGGYYAATPTWGGTSSPLPTSVGSYFSAYLARLTGAGEGVWAVGFPSRHYASCMTVALSGDGRVACLWGGEAMSGEESVSIGGATHRVYGGTLLGLYDRATGAHQASWLVANSFNLFGRAGMAFTAEGHVVLATTLQGAATFGAESFMGAVQGVVVSYAASGALHWARQVSSNSTADGLFLEGGGAILVSGTTAGQRVDLGGGVVTPAAGRDAFVSLVTPTP